MDRNGTEERVVEDEGGRHDVDFNLTSLSIQDHLDELHTIPLENIRNFCIIAHVVSECVYGEGGRIIVEFTVISHVRFLFYPCVGSW